MSLDGRAQVVPTRVAGPSRIETFDCSCGGIVHRTRGPFARCNECGAPHCVRCERPARRFRKGLTCGLTCGREGSNGDV